MLVLSLALATAPQFYDLDGTPLAGGDADGDGYDDVLVMGSNFGMLSLYPGTASGLDVGAPTWTLSVSFSTELDIQDVNGDGFDDLLLLDTDTDIATLFMGSAAGWPSTADWTSTVPDFTDVHLAADMNGDGFLEIVLGSITNDTVRVFFGTSTGASNVPDREYLHADEPGGMTFTSGDVNGDGYGDLMTTRGSYGLPAVLVFGSPSGPPPDLTSATVLPHQSSFYRELPAIVPDLDGDGIDDAIFANDDQFVIVPGSPLGLDPAAAAAPGAIELEFPGIESNTSAGGAHPFVMDANADGTPDLVLVLPIAYAEEASEGTLRMYEGGATGIDPSASWMAQGNARLARLGAFAQLDVDGDGLRELWTHSTNLGQRVHEASVLGLSGGMPSGIQISATPLQHAGLAVAGADLNGDGYSDLIVGESDTPDRDWGPPTRFHVLSGTSAGVSTIPTLTMDSFNAGDRIEPMGDLNGDGFDDVLLGQRRELEAATSPGPCWVYHPHYSYYYSSDEGYGCPYPTSSWEILFGSAAGLDTRTTRSEPDFFFGMAAANAGDVNGDGNVDVLAYYRQDRVGLWYGNGDGTFSATPDWVHTVQPADLHVANLLAGLGDINGDGFEDFAVGDPGIRPNTDPQPGLAQVFLGGMGGPTLHLELTGNTPDAGLGISIASADTNGDGLGDLLLGSMRDGAQVHLGSTTGMDAAPSWDVPWEDPLPHGYELSSAGDVDGDGLDDVLVRPLNVGEVKTHVPMGIGEYWGPESVRLFPGDPAGVASTPLWTMPSGWGAGTTVSGVGDLDADGLGDIALTGSQLLVIVYGIEILTGKGPSGPIDTGIEDTGIEDTGVSPGDTAPTDTGRGNTDPTDTDSTTNTSPTPSDSEEAKSCGCSSTSSSWWNLALFKRR